MPKLLILTSGSSVFRRLSSTLTAHLGQYRPRTHKSNQLDESAVDSRVDLCGWLVHNRKVSKNLGFFVLQDAHGQVQLLARQNNKSKAGSADGSLALGTTAASGSGTLELLDSVPLQSVVQVSGVVKRRLPSAVTPGPSGLIEVAVDSVQVLNPARRKLCFSPSNEVTLPAEDLRLAHRYLDLRRSRMSGNIRKRSEVARAVRNFLDEQEFVEVETPILLKSTPEGAREFLVPTRISKWNDPSSVFYALSQSPQIPKQILISSGAVEKYFQFARCFRDEDGRADRQPEFTQIDLEMAWVSWGPTGNSSSKSPPEAPFSEWRIGGEEVRDVVEGIMCRIWSQELEFPVMRYKDAMELYGSDKPDLRWDHKLLDITPLLPPESKQRLSDVGLSVEALVMPFSEINMTLDLLAPHVSPTVELHTIQPGASWECRTSLAPLSHDDVPNITIPGTESGATMLISTRPTVPEGGWTPLGRVRAALVTQFAPDPEAQKFLWVTEFPLFTRADKDKDFLARGRWSSSHHPFTAPMVEDLALLQEGGSALAKVRGQHYDLVLNGSEIAGGSVRIHDPHLQRRIFREVLQLSFMEAYGFQELVNALQSGAPPHAGIAIGFDRLMAIICGERSIRGVIAFPKTASGVDMLFQSPWPVPEETLALYGLQSTKKKPSSES